MVCGFCPGSGSSTEKSFNRADVFKRHLSSVRAIEQTPPNSRKKRSKGVNAGKKLAGYAPDATGKCSTCSAIFQNAQDFYEHLGDCVLHIIQQEGSTKATNARRLADVKNDHAVYEARCNNGLFSESRCTTASRRTQVSPNGSVQVSIRPQAHPFQRRRRSTH
jgi:hypothetical protein